MGLEKMHSCLRHGANTQQRIFVEVALLHQAIFHCDLESEHRAQPIDDCALDLCGCTAEIDHRVPISTAAVTLCTMILRLASTLTSAISAT